MRPTRSAETTNEAASTAIANGAVSHATSAPPSAGPEISAIASTASRLPLASSSRLRPDEVGDEHMVGQLVEHGGEAGDHGDRVQQRQRQHADRTRRAESSRARSRGRDRCRSAWAVAGAGRPSRRRPRNQRAGQRQRDGEKPKSKAPAPTTRIAAMGSAVRVMREPMAETPCALHSSRKSRCRHSARAAPRSRAGRALSRQRARSRARASREAARAAGRRG